MVASKEDLRSEVLHEEARRRTGLDDFGDAHYRGALEILLEAYRRESLLTEHGVRLVRHDIVRVLCNRLRVEQYWKERPELKQIPIERPIFILGLPRTGTTALHHLLGEDPRLQVLQYWLAAAPRPRPPRHTWEQEEDYRRAVAELEAMYRFDPTLRAVHLMTADGPEECRHLLQHCFTDDTFDCNATIPSYSRWYVACDMTPTYRRHRDLLRLIGSTSPERRWVLKYPVHMGNLPAILSVYPDACFVQCHRDPSRVIASICSLVAGWRAMYEEGFDRRALGQWQLELWAGRLERGIEVRRNLPPERFVDIHFRDFVNDPFSAVERIYRQFGIEMVPEAERRLRAWKSENPRDKYGRHQYSAEEFGFQEEALRERFAAYMKHFGVEPEGGV